VAKEFSKSTDACCTPSILLKFFSMVLAHPILHVIPEMEKEASDRLSAVVSSVISTVVLTSLMFDFGCCVHPKTKSRDARDRINDFIIRFLDCKITNLSQTIMHLCSLKL